MDAEGTVIAKTGYQQGGPEKYVKHLVKFVEVHDDVLAKTKELPQAQGLDCRLAARQTHRRLYRSG